MRSIIITSFLLVVSASVAACPIGLEKSYLDFGATGCSDNSGVRWLRGSLDRCPSGFVRKPDARGVEMCTDGRLGAYDLTSGCPSSFYPTIDAHGRRMCVDVAGKPAVELRDQLD